MAERVSELLIERPEDVFALRQSGRLAAAALGRDNADQVRLATALSELGREILTHRQKASASFTLAPDGSLLIDITGFPKRALKSTAQTSGIDAAQRLVGTIDVSETPRGVVLGLRMTPGPASAAKRQSLHDALAAAAAPRPLDELRMENRDLITTLSEIRAQQEQLMQLNAELEETNRGVMAMYSQLEDELEETNRGVVALYAELDDKTVALNEASEAKTRFLASVSHELRSPVNSILGLTALLLDPDVHAETGEQHKQLDLIRTASGELLKLVNGLLDLSKAESGRLDPDITRFPLDILLTELRGSLRPLVPPGVRLEIAENTRIDIESDRMLLGQVLRNLLTNALKFTVSGSVTLSCAQPNGYNIELRVMDTGIGIAPADQPRVFEEFYQVRGPLQAKSKGTGLGLPYARRVVETLGGTLKLESEVGAGTQVTVEVPARWQSLAVSDIPKPSEHLSLDTALLIDDDESIRIALRGMLQGIVKRVHEASGGHEGLALMESLHPDVVFLDLRMPDLDGAEVLSMVRRRPDLRDLPIVIVSSADLGIEETLGSMASIAKSALSKDSVARAIAKALKISGAA
jgi:signal transduction histidine kinase/CheY-like chemotaxis protein